MLRTARMMGALPSSETRRALTNTHDIQHRLEELDTDVVLDDKQDETGLQATSSI